MLQETALCVSQMKGLVWLKHKPTDCVGLMSSLRLRDLKESLLCLCGVGPGSHISEMKGQRLILEGWAVRSGLGDCKSRGVGGGDRVEG